MNAKKPNDLELTPTNVTLPAQTVAELDVMARENQTNRSQLVRQAIKDFMESSRAKPSAQFRPKR